MKEWPKISVVTPSYNQGAFLEQTIRSVLEQNYPNLEYIVIDGGSTDGSVDIIKKYADRLAYWVSEKDKGQSDALNKGFKRATGDIVAWLNSDDMHLPGALETVAKTFVDNPDVDFVFGDKLAVDENGNILRYERHTHFSFTAFVVIGSTLSQCATFWKRALFEKYGYIDDGLQYSMDYEFFCRIGAHINAKHIRKYLAKFRWHTSSKSSTPSERQRMEHNTARDRYLRSVCSGYPEILVKVTMHLCRAYWYTKQGDGFYVLRGICRRMLPRSLRPRSL